MKSLGLLGAAKHQVRILDIPVNVTTIENTLESVFDWVSDTVPRTVFVREVASLMAARAEDNLRKLHEVADLIVPDGMPLVWIGKLRGHGTDIERVSGADLVDAVCARSLQTGESHFFFGGKPGVAEMMAARLAAKYDGLCVAGTYSPPMRQIGSNYELDSEARAEINMIKAADPDFIWVGLSSPKQEYWMMKAAPMIGRGVMFGVGAAFDFHSGTVARAPSWMQRSGLEWLHRLASEPRRLWHRYLILAPQFVWLVAREEFRRRYSKET